MAPSSTARSLPSATRGNVYSGTSMLQSLASAERARSPLYSLPILVSDGSLSLTATASRIPTLVGSSVQRYVMRASQGRSI